MHILKQWRVRSYPIMCTDPLTTHPLMYKGTPHTLQRHLHCPRCTLLCLPDIKAQTIRQSDTPTLPHHTGSIAFSLWLQTLHTTCHWQCCVGGQTYHHHQRHDSSFGGAVSSSEHRSAHLTVQRYVLCDSLDRHLTPRCIEVVALSRSP